jgi:hypothetical protein
MHWARAPCDSATRRSTGRMAQRKAGGPPAPPAAAYHPAASLRDAAVPLPPRRRPVARGTQGRAARPRAGPDSCACSRRRRLGGAARRARANMRRPAGGGPPPARPVGGDHCGSLAAEIVRSGPARRAPIELRRRRVRRTLSPSRATRASAAASPQPRQPSGAGPGVSRAEGALRCGRSGSARTAPPAWRGTDGAVTASTGAARGRRGCRSRPVCVVRRGT